MMSEGDGKLPMPKYKCHKEVRALKIREVKTKRPYPSTTMLLIPEDQNFAPIEVLTDWVDEKQAHDGGYFVEYEDGYQSFSPAKAFEEGYTLIES